MRPVVLTWQVQHLAAVRQLVNFDQQLIISSFEQHFQPQSACIVVQE